jgi:hypothetical protein
MIKATRGMQEGEVGQKTKITVEMSLKDAVWYLYWMDIGTKKLGWSEGPVTKEIRRVVDLYN